MEVPNEDININSASSPKQEQAGASIAPHHISSSTRLMRNLAEKMRRDKLNTHISELAAIVPMVATATKRIDKTSVLRLSAAYLRIHQNILSEKIDRIDWKPYFLSEENLSSLLMEAINGFLLITTTTGKIIYVSEDIEKILGHSPVDVVGHSVYTILHPDDHVSFQQQLQCDQESNRRSFYCHFAERCLSRNDCGRYSLVHVLGRIRAAPCHSTDNSDIMTVVQENLFIGIVRLLRDRAINEISLMDGCHDEYITHHSLDARIICADHRISIIAGFLPEEVIGKSAYDYIFSEDFALSLFAHRQIFSNNHGTSKALYRLHTKTDKLIYLSTQGILQYNSVTGEVDSFICINKLLSDKQGKLELQRFNARYTPTIKEIVHEKDDQNTFKEENSSLLASTIIDLENPSTLQELWNPSLGPFPLSFVPSQSHFHNPKKTNKSSLFQDDSVLAKKFKQEPDSSDQRYERDSLFAKHDPNKLWHGETDANLKYYQVQTSTKACEKKSSTNHVNDYCHENVTSTTSDALSIQSNIPVSGNWPSPDEGQRNHMNTKTCGKKSTKKRTKQTESNSVNQFIPDKFYHENYNLNSDTKKCSFGTELEPHTPSKKHCSQLGVNMGESVGSTTKLEKCHPR